MSTLFYVSAAVALVSALMVVTRANAMHAALYLLLLLVSVASVFFALGAAFAAVLQLLIYAGAILVLFVFVVMILDLGREAQEREKRKMSWKMWCVPVLLGGVLIAQFLAALAQYQGLSHAQGSSPKSVGISLYTDYLVAVEVASLLLVAALVGAFHIGYRAAEPEGADE